MKCEKCNERDAVVFIQQVAGTESVELHLCEECARERGISASREGFELSLSGILKGLVDGTRAQAEEKRLCPGCGRSLAALRKEMRLGCAECYKAFQPEIMAMLRRSGIEPAHRGKLPRSLLGADKPDTGAVELRAKLARAIEAEEYEIAAALRDRIRLMDEEQPE